MEWPANLFLMPARDEGSGFHLSNGLAGDLPILGGRVHRITLPDDIDHNLTMLAASFSASPREYATYLLSRSIQRASIEYAFAMGCVDIVRQLGVCL